MDVKCEKELSGQSFSDWCRQSRTFVPGWLRDIKIQGYSIPSYKMAEYLHVIYAHPPIYFKSSIDYIWYLIWYKSYVSSCLETANLSFAFQNFLDIAIYFYEWDVRFYFIFYYKLSTESICCCSASQSCPTFSDPVDCSMPDFPVLHHHPEFAQTHVHWVDNATQPFHPQSSPSPPAFNLSQHQGLF